MLSPPVESRNQDGLPAIIRTLSIIPEMTMTKTSVITVAPTAPFDIELKKKVTDRTLPAKRRHRPNDLSISNGTFPYIAKREMAVITYAKITSSITAAQLARYFPVSSVIRLTGFVKSI